ncbi:MAG: hypothetical protein UY97_C0001G0087 [Parcubacteria group bacterium GW2011_GWB1_57_6]|nr:MAG: hypothetical protein UY93_C0004G0043 [Parcubacteria group bacterium GW2011_GWA1_56_13]KKW47030.1 MAG: hypothetical protein UY97_C0001G0087 [Parcubacteria group bacterium GW2011_GWB1_57_6]
MIPTDLRHYRHRSWVEWLDKDVRFGLTPKLVIILVLIGVAFGIDLIARGG